MTDLGASAETPGSHTGSNNNNNSNINTTNGNGGVVSPPPNKVAAQLTKMRDANLKYKNLLKMAKERIEQQEEELKRLRAEAEGQTKNGSGPERVDNSDLLGMDDMDLGESTGPAGIGADSGYSIVRIWQRIKVEAPAPSSSPSPSSSCDEVWALVELEQYVDPDLPMLSDKPKRLRKWKKFDSDNDLMDFIRRDTGEPLTLPPYSLTPQQSAKIQEEAKREVQQLTEEFRRFRVRSEMARKQADAQIRELQNTNVESAKRRIEGQEVEKELEQARSEHTLLEQARSEMAKQEAQWKEAYNALLAENTALKSAGSEAMLASQWRQRYEVCLKEKEEAQNQLKTEKEKASNGESGKYEMKYRDLKESFRLYRKKAKEIFEAQQTGQPNAQLLQMSEKSNEDSKLSYLKNLMVNYLTSDPAVREHMEGAIGTVLLFTPEDIEKIEQKKRESDYWGLF